QSPGLVASYSFSEGAGTTVADSSGNNNAGTLGSGVTWTTQGKFVNALVFNGSGFVTVPSAASLQLTSGMTLEAWVMPSSVTAAGALLQMGGDTVIGTQPQDALDAACADNSPLTGPARHADMNISVRRLGNAAPTFATNATQTHNADTSTRWLGLTAGNPETAA